MSYELCVELIEKQYARVNDTYHDALAHGLADPVVLIFDLDDPHGRKLADILARDAAAAHVAARNAPEHTRSVLMQAVERNELAAHDGADLGDEISRECFTKLRKNDPAEITVFAVAFGKIVVVRVKVDVRS